MFTDRHSENMTGLLSHLFHLRWNWVKERFEFIAATWRQLLRIDTVIKRLYYARISNYRRDSVTISVHALQRFRFVIYHNQRSLEGWESWKMARNERARGESELLLVTSLNIVLYQHSIKSFAITSWIPWHSFYMLDTFLSTLSENICPLRRVQLNIIPMEKSKSEGGNNANSQHHIIWVCSDIIWGIK